MFLFSAFFFKYLKWIVHVVFTKRFEVCGLHKAHLDMVRNNFFIKLSGIAKLLCYWYRYLLICLTNMFITSMKQSWSHREIELILCICISCLWYCFSKQALYRHHCVASDLSVSSATDLGPMYWSCECGYLGWPLQHVRQVARVVRALTSYHTGSKWRVPRLGGENLKKKNILSYSEWITILLLVEWEAPSMIESFVFSWEKTNVFSFFFYCSCSVRYALEIRKWP